MMNDALVNFLQPGQILSMVAAAGVNTPFPGVYDILGTGVGTAPQNIIGTRTLFGSDVGLGADKPQVQVNVATAFTTSNSCTLNIAFQAAVDQGVGGNYQPGTWITLVETGPIAVGNLTAGAVLARFDFPPAFPVGTLPRYLRLLGQVPAASNFTAGTLTGGVVTMVRDDYSAKYAAKNFSVA